MEERIIAMQPESSGGPQKGKERGGKTVISVTGGGITCYCRYLLRAAPGEIPSFPDQAGDYGGEAAPKRSDESG